MDPQTQSPVPVSNEPPAPNAGAVPQVVSALQNSKNVLVTVAADPSVDELASALGLTFLLGKLGKHATAVFSGKIPPAMDFLDPEKTFENTVDSLRDFIIALDKEKADKLRYKVEDDVVKVFITPYRTVLSEKDLQFSQGDFNVDVVMALGVTGREELDKAITAHGRILHDATVVTVNAAGQASGLGAVDWHEPAASSIAEMVVSLSDALGSDLLDGQISTALLTGIVAETNRFSNEKTSPKVMNLSAQLMAAGANQQLIATNLRQEGMISEPVRKKTADQPHDDGGEMVLNHKAEGTTEETGKNEPETPAPASKSTKKSPKKPANEKVEPTSSAVDTEPSADEQLQAAVDKAAAPAADSSAAPVPQGDSGSQTQNNTPADTNKPKIIEPLPPLPAAASPPPITPLTNPPSIDKPTFGGTLNATTAGAEEDRADQQAREAAVNHVALSHGQSTPPNDDAVEAARQAVEDANGAEPFNPANQPLASINAAPLPSIEPSPAPDSTVSALQSTMPAPEPEPSPVDAFMQPHTDTAAPAPLNAPTPASSALPAAQPVADTGGLPPLPPLPPADGSLPPMPPLPGQPSSDPAAAFQPQINPSFMQDMPQSQNPWTQAGDDLSAKQSEKDAARQEKSDKMAQQYDQAVDRNRELQGLPPLNNPNGSGLPPVPPV